jgi:hypothetical protein
MSLALRVGAGSGDFLLFNRQIIMYTKGQIIRFLMNLLDHTGRVKSYTVPVTQSSLLCLEYPWFCHLGLEAGALSSRELRYELTNALIFYPHRQFSIMM